MFNSGQGSVAKGRFAASRGRACNVDASRPYFATKVLRLGSAHRKGKSNSSARLAQLRMTDLERNILGDSIGTTAPSPAACDVYRQTFTKAPPKIFPKILLISLILSKNDPFPVPFNFEEFR
jgi:hypothetical protein